MRGMVREEQRDGKKEGEGAEERRRDLGISPARHEREAGDEVKRRGSPARSVEGGDFWAGELELLLLGLGAGDGSLELAQLCGSRQRQRVVEWIGGE